MNSKWIIYLNVKHKTITFSEDNAFENLRDLGWGQVLYNRYQKLGL